MLQDVSTPPLRQTSTIVLETERLALRKPTLADVKAMARLANDRRIAENTRRLPHPYRQDDAVRFITAMAKSQSETVFLIEEHHTPIGMVGGDWRQPDAPELGYWLGVEHWGRGFGTEAARASSIRRRATSWRSAASSGAASNCIASRRSARPRRSIASGCRAACGRR